MVAEVKLSITKSWVQNLSLPDERSNRETSRRIGCYSVYLVSLQRPTGTIYPVVFEKNCNTETQNLLHWCSANALEINPDKSALLTLPPKLRSPFPVLNINYNNTLIEMCASSKYLGINLDTKLDFKSHIANIETKISRSVGILSKLHFLFPSSTLLLLYFTLTLPHLL